MINLVGLGNPICKEVVKSAISWVSTKGGGYHLACHPETFAEIRRLWGFPSETPADFLTWAPKDVPSGINLVQDDVCAPFTIEIRENA